MARSRGFAGEAEVYAVEAHVGKPDCPQGERRRSRCTAATAAR